MIEAADLKVVRGNRVVLDGVDLVGHPGEVVGVVGPNGSGKSTLMLALYRSLKASGGKVLIDQQNIASLSRRQIASQVAVVAQEQETSLPLSVHDSVCLGRLANQTLASYGDQSDQELVEQALAKVNLTSLSHRLLNELSGGERQRALIARAIVQQASHLLLDEPTNHLDLHYQFELLDLISELDCTVVVVLHDLNLAAQCCDRVIVLDEGKVVAAGAPEQVLTAEILSPIYRLDITTTVHLGRPHLLFAPIRNNDAGQVPPAAWPASNLPQPITIEE